SKASEAIEHHERLVTLGKLIESLVMEEEFLDLKPKICESLYEKLKANLRQLGHLAFLGFRLQPLISIGVVMHCVET
ncbi:hypothetical protein MTR_0054s0270, partial [Medicago truncatula]